MPVGSRVSPALISQVGDLIQLVKELYADNQHLKKTIFDLSCVGFPGDNKPESVDQTEVRRNALIITSSSQRITAPHTCQGCICSGGLCGNYLCCGRALEAFLGQQVCL